MLKKSAKGTVIVKQKLDWDLFWFHFFKAFKHPLVIFIHGVSFGIGIGVWL